MTAERLELPREDCYSQVKKTGFKQLGQAGISQKQKLIEEDELIGVLSSCHKLMTLPGNPSRKQNHETGFPPESQVAPEKLSA